MGLTTPRFALRYPVAADPDNVPSDMLNLATDLDNKMQGYSQGTLAARPAAAITGREYYATDTKVTYMDIGTAWVIRSRPIADGIGVLAYNAAWPSSPVDGQETDRYSDAGGQQIWRFRYNAAGAAGYRWVFIGGAAYAVNLPASGAVEPTNRSNTWVSMGTTYTPGVAGFFDIDFIARLGTNANAAIEVWYALAAAAPGGALPAGANVAAWNGMAASGTAGLRATNFRLPAQLDFTGLVGTLLTVWGNQSSSTGSTGNHDCGLRITPARCG